MFPNTCKNKSHEFGKIYSACGGEVVTNTGTKHVDAFFGNLRKTIAFQIGDKINRGLLAASQLADAGAGIWLGPGPKFDNFAVFDPQAFVAFSGPRIEIGLENGTYFIDTHETIKNNSNFHNISNVKSESQSSSNLPNFPAQLSNSESSEYAERNDKNIKRYVTTKQGLPNWKIITRIITDIPSKGIVLQDEPVSDNNRDAMPYWHRALPPVATSSDMKDVIIRTRLYYQTVSKSTSSSSTSPQPDEPPTHAHARLPQSDPIAIHDEPEPISADSENVGNHSQEINLQGENPENIQIKVIKNPTLPSQAEIDSHNASGHTPFRSWCPVCVEACARDNPHLRSQEPSHDFPVFGFDYAFMGSKV